MFTTFLSPTQEAAPRHAVAGTIGGRVSLLGSLSHAFPAVWGNAV